MIISDSKKFVFVHIPKTAGMSVRKVLQKHATVGVWQHHQWPGNKQTNPELCKHAFAGTLEKHVDAWDRYYRFAFVRNPWSWLVSVFFYIRKDKNDPRNKRALRMSFADFVLWFADWDKKTYPIRGGQYEYIYNKQNKLQVNFVGKLESFSRDFAEVCHAIGVPYQASHENITPHQNYKTYYDQKTTDLVRRLLKRDMDTFGYAITNHGS